MATNCVLRVVGFSILLTIVLAEVNIVSRSEWNAKEPANQLTRLELPVGRVIFAHTAAQVCDTKETCSQAVSSIQSYHMKNNKMDDIAYNYLIGNDGNIYEGRGAEYQAAVARGQNAGSYGIAFMGNFVKELPSVKALEAAKALLEKLVGQKNLKEDYKIVAHSQLAATVSPGDALLAEIKTWPKWSERV